MSNDINVNKVNKAQEKQAEKLADKFEQQGLGHDQAKNEALEQVAGQGNTGGNHGSGDKPKHANHQGDHRTGTESNASK